MHVNHFIDDFDTRTRQSVEYMMKYIAHINTMDDRSNMLAHRNGGCIIVSVQSVSGELFNQSEIYDHPAKGLNYGRSF
jgi:hypothetical protein